MNEAQLHQMVCSYLKIQYKDVIFRTDFAAGIKMTIGQARKHKALQHSRAFPDLFIACPVGKYHGLFIELKREGTRIYLKNGELTKDPHIREQTTMLDHLRSLGYFSAMCAGFEPAKLVIDSYLKHREVHQWQPGS